MERKKIKSWVLILVMACGALGSCKHYFDPPMVFEQDSNQGFAKPRKVLLIVVEGLSGPELAKDVPPNIAGILPHSKYTFEGFVDPKTTDAATWVTLASGRGFNFHGVSDSSFNIISDAPDDPDDVTSAGGYTTFFQRVLESGRKYKTFAATSWPNLSQHVFQLADQNVLTENDAATKDSTIAKLAKAENNLALAVVDFNQVNLAGIAGGFSMDNAAYKTAINTVDGYIGDILEAMKARENYAGEDWLVIVTSNHGGLGSNYGGASIPERKVPMIYYHPDMQEQQFTVSSFTNAVSMRSGIFGRIEAGNADRYNLGTSGEYTIQTKFMVNQFGTLNPAIISKQGNSGNSDDGWSFIHNGGDGWRFKIKGTQVSAPGKFELNKWYTLTARIYMDGGTRKAQVFTNGELKGEIAINTAQGSSTSNLNIGYSTSYQGGTVIQTLQDLQIFDKALPTEYITANYCRIGFPEDDPYFAQLIGYWGLNDGIGGEMANNISGAPGFILNGAYQWSFMSDDFCQMNIPDDDEKEDSNSLFTYNTDITRNIYYWLLINPATAWGLEGSNWLEKYETEFLVNYYTTK